MEFVFLFNTQQSNILIQLAVVILIRFPLLLCQCCEFPSFVAFIILFSQKLLFKRITITRVNKQFNSQVGTMCSIYFYFVFEKSLNRDKYLEGDYVISFNDLYKPSTIMTRPRQKQQEQWPHRLRALHGLSQADDREIKSRNR